MDPKCGLCARIGTNDMGGPKTHSPGCPNGGRDQVEHISIDDALHRLRQIMGLAGEMSVHPDDWDRWEVEELFELIDTQATDFGAMPKAWREGVKRRNRMENL